MKRFTVLLLLALGGGASGAAPLPDPSPQTVEAFCAYIEWVLQVPLTLKQRDEAAQHIRAIVDNKDSYAAEIVRDVLVAHADLANHSEEDLSAFRGSVEDELLKGLRRYRKKPLAEWIAAVKASASKPVVPGSPPLTRQSADALVELMAFLAAEAGSSAEPAQLEDFAKTLGSDYRKYSEEQQLALSELPAAWAALRLSWKDKSAEQRKMLRAAWRKSLSPSTDGGQIDFHQVAPSLVTQIPEWL